MARQNREHLYTAQKSPSYPHVTPERPAIPGGEATPAGAPGGPTPGPRPSSELREAVKHAVIFGIGGAMGPIIVTALEHLPPLATILHEPRPWAIVLEWSARFFLVWSLAWFFVTYKPLRRRTE